MADKFEAFNNDMRVVQAKDDDNKRNVVRRKILVNLPNTFSLLPINTITSSSTQNICLTISPHPTPTYTISPQMPSAYAIDPKIFNIIMPTNIHSPSMVFPSKGIKHDQLAICQYARREKEIQSIRHENWDKELHNLRKDFDEELRSRNYQGLRYEDLCVHPNTELPPGYELPRFNTFSGIGDPIAHLRDYCSRLIGIGHDEAIRMRLFIQSLSGLALNWYTNQDFSKWHTWEDMARDFVKQYEFNIEDDMHIADLLKVKKLLHESFQEYAIRWRLEASKIHPPVPEQELILAFIQIQEGLYYDKLLGTCARNFSDLIRIGKELESGIQGGRIIDNSEAQVVHESFQMKIPKNSQSKDSSTSMNMQQSQNHQFSQPQATSNLCDVHLSPCKQNFQNSCQHQLRNAQSCSRQKKKMKSFSFTPLDEPLAHIFARLKAKGVLQPKKGFIPKHPPQNFDLSKSCAYHSSIRGHDIENCLALKFKIQSMIESGKIKVQHEHSSSNSYMANASTIFVKGDPSKFAPRYLKRKRATSQED